MYKLKYYSLSQEEKKSLKEDFYKTDYGKMIKTRLDRVFIIGLMSFAFGILLIIIRTSIWDIFSGISLIIASFIFIIGSFKVRINKINDFLVKQKRNK